MSDQYSVLWNKVLNEIRNEIGSTSFDIWFSMLSYQYTNDHIMYINVPNSLTKEWIENTGLPTEEKALYS
jgi:chromosomal replication initiator protein